MSDAERADETTDRRMVGLLGWAVAIGFMVLWLAGGCE